MLSTKSRAMLAAKQQRAIRMSNDTADHISDLSTNMSNRIMIAADSQRAAQRGLAAGAKVIGSKRAAPFRQKRMANGATKMVVEDLDEEEVDEQGNPLAPRQPQRKRRKKGRKTRAVGDVFKPGEVAPYAYLQISAGMLSKRNKHKRQGTFDKVIKSAQRGVGRAGKGKRGRSRGKGRESRNG